MSAALLLQRTLALLAATLVTLAAFPASASAHAPRPADVARTLDQPTIDCPIPSQSDFIDSWGDPRSGGRRHQGVDMIATRGTPIAAAESGFAEFKNSSAGGKAIWLTTDEGDKFYYAHLDDWEGDSRDVDAGEIVGYVGSSGNAQGNHLHFELHLDGTPTNPFPAVSDACTDEFEAILSVGPLALLPLYR
jgi:murein DD-endopeptidase MepM/ murein hydrolase activator NlpD